MRVLVRWDRSVLPTAPDAASNMSNFYLHFSSSFLLSLAFIVIITLLLPSPFLSLPLSYTRKLSRRPHTLPRRRVASSALAVSTFHVPVAYNFTQL